MDFIKNLFKDEDKVIGLCSFKKHTQKIYSFSPKFNDNIELFYSTNTKNNFLLS